MDPASFAKSWMGAFNARDVDAIMAHYADDIEHSSPTVTRILGEPSGVVRGKAALRAYFFAALESAGPSLHYELQRTYIGAHGVTLLYHRSGGKLVAETFQFDARGLVRHAFVAHDEPVSPRIEQNHFVLAVPDKRASAAFFRDVLGFRVVNEPPGWIFLSRDACMIMLGECPEALPAAKLGDHSYFGYLVVDDADALHAHAARVAGPAIGALTDQPWGMREFTVRTPDGHRLMVGATIRHQR